MNLKHDCQSKLYFLYKDRIYGRAVAYKEVAGECMNDCFCIFNCGSFIVL